MTYYGAKELAASFRTVRKNTLAVAQDIPADKYDFRSAADCRTVAELLTHIALSYNFQNQIQAVDHATTLQGFNFGALMAQWPPNRKSPALRTRFWSCCARAAKSGPDGSRG